ncbi:Protein of unknown function [Pyronema omphalodes CBS 100304]|uniref:Uncharacterized protein n=1 Tax=Pyronema omphalodes (strain CBS 100304) TaxID=1076935 RepID=U4LC60_PYROM|nr:Protein of unknown function [Pyronema omphalodes CBS 100304]
MTLHLPYPPLIHHTRDHWRALCHPSVSPDSALTLQSGPVSSAVVGCPGSLVPLEISSVGITVHCLYYPYSKTVYLPTPLGPTTRRSSRLRS